MPVALDNNYALNYECMFTSTATTTTITPTTTTTSTTTTTTTKPTTTTTTTTIHKHLERCLTAVYAHLPIIAEVHRYTHEC